MSLNVLSSLEPHLEIAHRIVETVVIRSRAGAVYTISIGESILSGSPNALGAKVTLLDGAETHLEICEGATTEEVLESAQQIILKSIESGRPQTAVPKPHAATAAKRATT